MSALLRCPNCGRLPRLRERFHYGGFGAPSLYIFKFDCRQWFGLRLCFGPQADHWIDKNWADLGLREAARKWNAAVDAERGKA